MKVERNVKNELAYLLHFLVIFSPNRYLYIINNECAINM